MANFEHAEDDPKHVNMSSETPAACAGGDTADVSTLPGGDVGTIPCTIPSFAAASELLSAPYSCLVMNTHRRHVALPPVYLHKKRTGIQEELETELLKFSQSLNGVPLAYDNIRILGHQGHIYDDSGYIHIDIEANFIVFQPKKGQTLLGTVNKLGVSHVGCLVHGCFNASIPRPKLVSMETWRDAGPRIGAELEFEVIALDADAAGVLLIRGRLNRTRVQELLAMGESSESSFPADQPEQQEEEEPGANSNLEPAQECPEETPKKKKKKKKDKVKEEDNEETISNIPTSQTDNMMEKTNGEDGEKKKKKKKKKDKEVKEEEEDVEISPMEVHGSDSSGYHSDKPSKKRKHETDNDVASSFNEDDTPTKPKKKKKKNKEDIEQFA